MKIDLQDGSFIDTDYATIRVQAFKRSGKWYASSSLVVKPGEGYQWMVDRPWELADKIKANDSSISFMSPVSDFSDEFIYVLDGFFPASQNGFCTMLVDANAR